MKIKVKQRGFSLVEMIIYIAILSFVLALIVEVVLSVSRSERIIKATRSVENSAVVSLERIGREVRSAQSVDAAKSSFGTHPGTLVLDGLDENGNPREVAFSFSDGQIIYSLNGAAVGSLTEEATRVTDLKFYRLSSGNGEAVRTEITLESGTSTYYRVENFYAASALR